MISWQKYKKSFWSEKTDQKIDVKNIEKNIREKQAGKKRKNLKTTSRDP